MQFKEFSAIYRSYFCALFYCEECDRESNEVFPKDFYNEFLESLKADRGKVIRCLSCDEVV